MRSCSAGFRFALRRPWRFLVPVLLLAALPARAHIGDQYNSIHFHSGKPDFGTVPRRAPVREWDDRELNEGYEGYSERIGVELTPGKDDRRANARRNMLWFADACLRRGQWVRARRAYAWVGAKYNWRGGVRDRWEVLQQADALPRPWSAAFHRALRTYMDALTRYDAARWPEARQKLERVQRDPAARFLRAHALYQVASIAYEKRDYARAVALYRKVLGRFPRSAKREAALLMTARCALLPPNPDSRRLATGRAALDALERDYPRTRFRRSIRRLRGHLLYVGGRYPEALRAYYQAGDLESMEIVRPRLAPAAQSQARVWLLAGYLRRMAGAVTFDAYDRAVRKADVTRKTLRSGEAARFSRLLMREPTLAASYLYFRLYHCENTPADLSGLGLLAYRLVAGRTGGSARFLPPLVRVRLAEVYYQLRLYRRAERWAGSAADARAPAAAQDRALYVRGAARHRLGVYRSARRDFETLLRRYPRSPLWRGAREELALVNEAAGDLGGALEQYFALGYYADIAFLLDARMSTGEIERYLRRHPDRRVRDGEMGWNWKDELPKRFTYTERDLLAYTLGIRYMREERWEEAARWLRRVPRARYRVFSQGRRTWDTGNETCPDPLTGVRELSRLHRAAARARPGSPRAAALYAYASYYYKHGTLLLYNPALWQGLREYNFDFWWNDRHATPQDRQAARAHMYAHESYARAYRLCLEVARLYPRSPDAPRALYRAGCAAHNLSGFNAWWRSQEGKHRDLHDEGVRLMQRLANRYPRHPLAREARKYAVVFAQEQRARWARAAAW